jgi:diazepam-binding inhibitor (GABA receptor modulating acyl-CoA-binding protein)
MAAHWTTLRQIQGKAKHRAWKKVVDENVTPAEAEKKYVTLVEELKSKYGTA